MSQFSHIDPDSIYTEQFFKDHLSWQPQYQIVADWICNAWCRCFSRHHGTQLPIRVLDVGCGNAFLLHRLMHNALRANISDKMVMIPIYEPVSLLDSRDILAPDTFKSARVRAIDPAIQFTGIDCSRNAIAAAKDTFSDIAKNAINGWSETHGVSTCFLSFSNQGFSYIRLIEQDYTDSGLSFETNNHLVICTEVAEHIDATDARPFCRKLCASLEPGGMLYFTAATPGQCGTWHVNLQPHRYWISIFEDLGLKYNDRLGVDMSWSVSPAISSVPWLSENAMFFEKPMPK